MLAIILAALSGIVMMFGGIRSHARGAHIALLLSLMVLIGSIVSYQDIYDIQIPNADNFFRFSTVNKAMVVLVSFLFTLYIGIFGSSIEKIGTHRSEYFALLFFILCGMFQVIFQKNLLSLFLGIEIMTIPQYVLAGSDKENVKSNEASLKYFLMGAFASGILLMGIAMLYGATGTFDLDAEQIYFSDSIGNSMAILGVALVIIGLSFKASLVPFHIWAPDVYDGSPTPITPFMSTIVKVVVIYTFYQFVRFAGGEYYWKWQIVLAIIAAATLILGNITAVYQQSVKRMLAYSSIAQAGFMILPIVVMNDMSLPHMVLYFVSYTAANLGLFAVLVHLRDYTYDGFINLGKTHPFLAFVVTVFVLSLAGLPISGGFFAKLFALMHVMSEPTMVWLAVIGVLMAAVSVYYYFRVIWAMYFRKGEGPDMIPMPQSLKIWLGLLTIIVLVLGIFPDLLSPYFH